MKHKEEPLPDTSPTDELPVLTEQDVVHFPTGTHLATAPVAAPDLPQQGSHAEDSLLDATTTLLRAVPDRSAPEERDRVAALEARLAELEAELEDRNALIVSLEERLRATRAAVARRDESLRSLTAQLEDMTERLRETEARLDEALMTERAEAKVESSRSSGQATSANKPRVMAAAQAALARSREEAAALAAYIDRRRAHWLELADRLRDERAKVRDLERELEQRVSRERRERERANAEAERAEKLASELATTRRLLEHHGPLGHGILGAPPNGLHNESTSK
ncbi:MAG: hypothetical protein C0P79_001645 [Gammaproteobacteria bacterium]|nr:hypothetical protein [Gammaproteobacteria bacterium]